MEHHQCVSVKPNLQGTTSIFCSLCEIHTTEFPASCQSLRALCHFFLKRSSFQDQPPSQEQTLASTLRLADSEETVPQTQKQRNTTKLLTSQTFSPMAAGKSFPLLLIQVGQNYCRESLLLPSPRAMQSQGRNGFMGTPCCLASDFPPKYGIGKRLQGYGGDLHTALLSSAISLKNQPFNCGHISTSPNLLIIDSW